MSQIVNLQRYPSGLIPARDCHYIVGGQMIVPDLRTLIALLCSELLIANPEKTVRWPLRQGVFFVNEPLGAGWFPASGWVLLRALPQ
jgi:hypothetical protein